MKAEDLKPGDVIKLGSHPWNTGDVYGVFVITQKDDYGLMMRSTCWEKGNVSRPDWTRFFEYCRSFDGFKGCKIRRIA